MRRTVAVLALVAALLAGCDDRPTSHTYHCADGTIVSGPGARQSSCDQHGGTDLGAEIPGAFCATDRFGKQFVRDGITYTCKGPKPYRWRP